jgi:hypothetical protein
VREAAANTITSPSRAGALAVGSGGEPFPAQAARIAALSRKMRMRRMRAPPHVSSRATRAPAGPGSKPPMASSSSRKRRLLNTLQQSLHRRGPEERLRDDQVVTGFRQGQEPQPEDPGDGQHPRPRIGQPGGERRGHLQMIPGPPAEGGKGRGRDALPTKPPRQDPLAARPALPQENPQAGPGQILEVMDPTGVAGRHHHSFHPAGQGDDRHGAPGQDATDRREIVHPPHRIREMGAGDVELPARQGLQRRLAVHRDPAQAIFREPFPQMRGQQRQGRVAPSR